MRFLARSLSGVALTLAALGLLAWGALMVRDARTAGGEGGFGGRPAAERAYAARVLPVLPETIAPTLAAFGEVRAARTVELRAPAQGRVVELAPGFAEGGIVASGDVLLRVDPADARAALARAEAAEAEAEAETRDARRAEVLARAELEAAEAQAATQRRALDRAEDLLGRGTGTAAARETAEIAVQSAEQAVLARRQALAAAEARIDRAALAERRAALDLAEARRGAEDTVLAAPFGGILQSVAVAEGVLLTPNERLATLVDASALEVAFRLSTAAHARLSAAGPLSERPVLVTLGVDGLDLEAEAVITREAAATGEGGSGRLVFAAVEDAPWLRPGDFVEVRVREPALEGVARLPGAAVASDGTVLILGAEDRMEERPAPILRREGDDVIVDAARIAGEEVVAERTPLLGPGIVLRPIRPEGAARPPAGPETVRLDEGRRAALIAFVEDSDRIPSEAKERVLAQLRADRVPLQVVERIERRMGG
ncbi:biotin/lipoyl-binding protein [Hasllibacter halocynthiae]|uniref:Biotin/lipoyl-binding protein n=1 Tax=Hasllibacter halocynthiae TaxID=595589 RepID=A0A2T0X3U1_9RHOB|nr:HlyD family efflux transporter periplasmic adaptor subunit [Hasllibacter halocynthiae]PRY93608.1 biotin/lipoyl-binding protein [Hasllibacter halocynthiae]